MEGIDFYKQEVQKEKKDLEKFLDFKFETPFWEIFSLAELIGTDYIRENYDFVFMMSKDNLMNLTELALVLNLKIYRWYQKNDAYGLTYDELWKKTDAYALGTLKGDHLHYYLSTLD